MTAKQFFESQLLTDANSVVDKLKHKYTRDELIKFADAYAEFQKAKWQEEAVKEVVEKLEALSNNYVALGGYYAIHKIALDVLIGEIKEENNI